MSLLGTQRSDNSRQATLAGVSASASAVARGLGGLRPVSSTATGGSGDQRKQVSQKRAREIEEKPQVGIHLSDRDNHGD